MRFSIGFLVLLVPISVLNPPAFGQGSGELIAFSNPESLASRTPILIAHRGGVITATAPECSLAAIRLAGQDGYDMVELDIQATKDNLAVVFHDRNLEEDAGKKGRVSDYDRDELIQWPLLGTEEKIPTLEQALSLCREIGLGVMLDFKTEGAENYYRHVHDAIRDAGLHESTITITSRKAIREFFMIDLKSPIWFRVLDGDDPLSKGRYAFDRASAFDRERIEELHSRGLLAIPALNTFHYPPETNLRDAARDAERLLELGVDGFQIDSVYQHFFGLPRRPLPGFEGE
ncbi:MAG: glycerophosphodiester phosphodiesterase family protein [Candidatus Omnitrophica bacterium]|nr:glycerophosphodiester phosphodiesterase family protein [Candidatus Omnitrophota bacterium]